jgi:hypothetical protein
MHEIKAYISLLSPTERAAFVSHLQKRNKRSDAKNIALFQAMLKGEEELVKSKMSSNAYHVLKKRLTDRLADYTAGSIIESEQTRAVEIMKTLVLSQKLFKLKHFKTGYKQLKKAEAKAKEIADYHLLNEIYQTYIQYSYHALSPSQTELFEAYEKNKIAYANYANLNMVYALVRKAFQNQEKEDKPLDLDDLIRKNYSLYGISNAAGYNFQTLNQIAEIADIAAAYNRNYFRTNLFFEKHIKELAGGSLDTEKQLTNHIKLLYTVAHIYFRKQQFKKSIENLRKMHKQMQRYEAKYYALYEVRYTTLLALNYNFSGEWRKAASILDDLLAKTAKAKQQERSILQAILIRSVIHFQQEEFSQAKQMMSKLWQQDSFYIKNLGLEWLINKKFIEILIAIELGDTDAVDSLITSLYRKRSEYFTGANAIALPFLKLMETYHKQPQHVKTPSFEAEVEATFEWKPSEEEDLFFISYYAWLKSKMTQKAVYTITLNFLENAKG